MNTFTITIRTENDAFQGGNLAPEVARILQELATTIAGDAMPHSGRALYDINGNRVGVAEYGMGRRS